MNAREELARDIFTADNSKFPEEQAHAEWAEWSKGGIDPKQNYCYGIADGLIAKGYAKPRAIGYIIVDIKTRNLNWDGELHPTEASAIQSLTGPYQSYCTDPEEETEDRLFWGRHYMICPVGTAEAQS